MKRKLFGWTRFRLSSEEAEDTVAARERANRIAEAADKFQQEAPAVGERQRQLRRENHFGRRLDTLYKEA
ncbi:hypothetical protein SEA_ALTADENA_25 [Arthrobacter phage Altadena]|uniref:Uncharacterized protein n=1 Tax=Arthrobacter phage Altadena TaxID=3059064 RepID=A0AA96KIE5_9CAUD|nr:hypothetical protein SEA_ALTADENA_25 [Arthrobacter phage Altadena]